jgi:hypothetical protein
VKGNKKRPTQHARKIARRTLIKTVKGILRNAQQGAVPRSKLTGTIATELRARGWFVPSRIKINTPRPRTLSAQVTAHQGSLRLTLSVWRTNP